MQGLGFLGFRVFLLLEFAWFAYSRVGFRFFERVEVFSCQGISQGQLCLCRVQISLCLELFCFQDWLGLVKGEQFLVFFCVQRTFLLRVYLRVSYGSLWLSFFLGFRVLLLLGLAEFYYGWVVFRIFLRLEVFSVRVYLRVSYGFVGLRFLRFQSSFAPSVCQVCLRLLRVQGFSAFRSLFLLGYILGLVMVVQG